MKIEKTKKINKKKVFIRVMCVIIIYIALQIAFYDVVNDLEGILVLEQSYGYLFSLLSITYSVLTFVLLGIDIKRSIRGNPWNPWD